MVAIALKNKRFEPETDNQSSDVCEPFEIALLVTLYPIPHIELQNLNVININVIDRKYTYQIKRLSS